MINSKVTFLIPVRNEYSNLKLNKNDYETLVADGHQIIIINDASTDSTKTLLEKEFGFCRIINLSESDRKNSIIGKNNALIYGYKYIENELLCFVDADVFNVNSKNMKKILQKYESDKVYTTIPKFINKGIKENFSFFFQQILYFNFAKLKTDSELFGGFYLLGKNLYDKIGGHQVVSQNIVEDLALGNLLAQNNPIIILTETGFSIRMYTSFKDIITGWHKNISYGFKYIKRKNSIILTSYLIILGILLFSKYWLFSYVIITIIFIYTSKFYLQTNKIYILFWPLYYLFFIFIFFYSLVRKKKRWKDRVYYSVGEK